METINAYEIKKINWVTKTFIIKRETLPFDQLKDFFSRAYGEIYAALGARGLQPQQPFAIYFNVDTTAMKTDLAAAVAVPEQTEIPGLAKLTIPAAAALVITHYGPYENMTAAYNALDTYLEKNKLQKGWMLEEYLSDPEVEKDPAKWKTNIYCILK